MTLRDIARPREELVSASPDTPVTELATQMRERTVGSVVIEEAGKPIGIVTDRDLAMKIVATGKDPLNMTAADVMNGNTVTVDIDAGVFDVCQTMREHAVRRLPVMENNQLTGIITLDDIIVLLEDELHDLSEVIRSESPPYALP
ncbi:MULTISPECIES: CBS domain-containing protein [unclassified Haladaptatus]|uniref:CBS domain-containing protein n=1 Tax=unclassified Haladaptatus TaxID=2622732 RepID=UPI0023E77C8B|nr:MULTISPECIES: CBS domain-containing protein [unclassified Haladaptatus]